MRKNINKAELADWKNLYLCWKTAEKYLKKLAKINKDDPTVYEKCIEGATNAREFKIDAKNQIALIKKRVC